MIVNSKEILEQAKREKYAIPHFNINNLEWTRFILEECNNCNSPLIIGASENAIKYMGGYKIVVDLIRDMVEELEIKIPVVIHLDHGSDVTNCKKAIDAGFTSVMIDGSRYSLIDNINMTKEVVEYARNKNITIEAEVGHISGQAENETKDLAYAKVDDCIYFSKETDIDSLAPALGSVHGLYHGEPKFDFVRMLEINEKINKPLVLHGGTGIPDVMIKKAINCGIAKININTELQIVWSNAIRKYLAETEEYDPRKIIKSGEMAMKQVIRDKIILFGSMNKA